jgi:SAM-dependent methyltransferase
VIGEHLGVAWRGIFLIDRSIRQVRIPLSRTRAKFVHQAKSFVYDKADFQKMVDLRELHQLEDSMGFRGQWESHRRFQIDILKRQGLLPKHTFLELGCGPLTGGIPVIEYLYAGNYTGVDIRSSVLNLSWREVSKAGLSAKNPRLICSSNFASEYLGDAKFDFVYSLSVLYHLSDDILDKYFATVARRLNPAGKCIANINNHIPSDKWLEFPFLKRDLETYCAVASKHGLTVRDLGEIGELGFDGGTERHNPLLSIQLNGNVAG